MQYERCVSFAHMVRRMSTQLFPLNPVFFVYACDPGACCGQASWPVREPQDSHSWPPFSLNAGDSCLPAHLTTRVPALCPLSQLLGTCVSLPASVPLPLWTDGLQSPPVVSVIPLLAAWLRRPRHDPGSRVRLASWPSLIQDGFTLSSVTAVS